VLLQNGLNTILQASRLDHFVLDFSHFQCFFCLHCDLRGKALQILVKLECIFVILLKVEEGKFEKQKHADGITHGWVAQLAHIDVELQVFEVLL
jgi:hypothetical protein